MGCGHWQSEYDASPCSYCAADEEASEKRRIQNEAKDAELKAAYERIKELEEWRNIHSIANGCITSVRFAEAKTEKFKKHVLTLRTALEGVLNIGFGTHIPVGLWLTSDMLKFLDGGRVRQHWADITKALIETADKPTHGKVHELNDTGCTYVDGGVECQNETHWRFT